MHYLIFIKVLSKLPTSFNTSKQCEVENKTNILSPVFGGAVTFDAFLESAFDTGLFGSAAPACDIFTYIVILFDKLIQLNINNGSHGNFQEPNTSRRWHSKLIEKSIDTLRFVLEYSLVD